MQYFDHATVQTFLIDGKREEHFWVIGNPTHPPLLILHGFSGTHKDLLVITDHLREKYFVIVPDLPGWGDSPRFKSPLTIHNYAKFLQKLLDHLHVKQVTVIGHCMGATLAIEFAAFFPDAVKQLLLISAPYTRGMVAEVFFQHLSGWADQSPKRLRWLYYLWRFRGINFSFSMITMRFRSLRKKLRIGVRFLKDQSSIHEDSVQEAWNSMMHYNYDKAKLVTVPVHLFHGEEDLVIPPHQAMKLQELFPNATLDLIPRAGHLPPMETPGTLENYMLKYL